MSIQDILDQIKVEGCKQSRSLGDYTPISLDDAVDTYGLKIYRAKYAWVWKVEICTYENLVAVWTGVFVTSGKRYIVLGEPSAKIAVWLDEE